MFEILKEAWSDSVRLWWVWIIFLVGFKLMWWVMNGIYNAGQEIEGAGRDIETEEHNLTLEEREQIDFMNQKGGS